jgi:hypothetical protein
MVSEQVHDLHITTHSNVTVSLGVSTAFPPSLFFSSLEPSDYLLACTSSLGQKTQAHYGHPRHRSLQGSHAAQ